MIKIFYIFCTITHSNGWSRIDPEAQKCKQEKKTIWRLNKHLACKWGKCICVHWHSLKVFGMSWRRLYRVLDPTRSWPKMYAPLDGNKSPYMVKKWKATLHQLGLEELLQKT